MPITRSGLLLVSVLIVVALVGVYFLIPKLAGLKQTWGQLRRGDPRVARGGRRAGAAVDRRLRDVVSGRVRSWRASDRLACESGDPARRDRGDSPGCSGRRGRGGCHRLGARPRRHVRRGDRLPHRRESGDPVLGLPRGGDRLRAGAVGWGLRRRRLGRDHALSGRLGGSAGWPRVLSMALLPATSSSGSRVSRVATSAFGRLARRLAKAPDALGSGVRTAWRPGSAAAAGAVGGGGLLGLRHRCARRLLRCVWEGCAGGCPGDGLLPWHAREPASTPRWRWRGRGRNDRARSSHSACPRAAPWSRCWLTARSHSGSRHCPASPGISRCARRSADGERPTPGTSAHGCAEHSHQTPCDEEDQLMIVRRARLPVLDREPSVC